MKLELREIKHGQLRRFRLGLQVFDESVGWEPQPNWIKRQVDDEGNELNTFEFAANVDAVLKNDYYAYIAMKAGFFAEGAPKTREELDELEEEEVQQMAIAAIDAYVDKITIKKK